MKEYKISEITDIKINGRTVTDRDTLPLFWTAAGFEVNAKGSELWVELEAGYDPYEPWFSIIINGAFVAKQMAQKGRSRVCLFRGMNPEEVKHVKFVRDVQAMSDDPESYLTVCSLFFDGEFLPVEEKPYKLEFIGDSITSGEGTYGARKEMDWISMFFSGVNNYAVYTAEALQADLRIVSQSGWGVLCSWDGVPEHSLPQYYEKVCGLLSGEHNRALGAFEEYDFESWQPDAVIVNLGTNDGAAFSIEGFPFTKADFEAAVTAFLGKIRRYNKTASIVWAYGMIGTQMQESICKAIEDYRRESGDVKVHYLPLPEATEDTIGSREHPGIRNHKMAAAILSDYVRKLL